MTIFGKRLSEYVALFGWLVGCVIMFATKKLVTNKDTNATARA